MTPDKEYEFISGFNGGIRRFVLYVGTRQQLLEATNVLQAVPESNKLYSNYPNPFNAFTCIEYDVAENNSLALVKLEIYNIRGQLVERLVNDFKKPGRYKVISHKCTNSHCSNKENFPDCIPKIVLIYVY